MKKPSVRTGIVSLLGLSGLVAFAGHLHAGAPPAAVIAGQNLDEYRDEHCVQDAAGLSVPSRQALSEYLLRHSSVSRLTVGLAASVPYVSSPGSVCGPGN